MKTQTKKLPTYRRRRLQLDYGTETRTEQHHKKACDINTIMAKYVKTGLIDHVNKHQGTYGDATSADFKAAQDLVAEQKSIFHDLPAEVRKEFDNDPGNYLDLITADGGIEKLQNILNPPIEEEVPEIEEKPLQDKLEPETE